MKPTIRVEGLRELRRDLKQANNANPRELTRALKEAGEPVPGAMRQFVPTRTGKRSSAIREAIGKPTASGTKGRIPVRHPAAGVVEFMQTGSRGATLTERYGPPPRFGYRGLESVEDDVAKILDKELKDILTAYGWAR